MLIALDDAFPREYALTGAFRYGLPRTFEFSDDAVTFLRSADGYDPKLGLWRYDLATGTETPLVLPAALAVDDADLPAAERARRERLRESGGGITAYSMSSNGKRITFAVGGVLWLWDALGLRSLETPGAVVDPRIDPTGELVACVINGAVHVYRFTDGDEVACIARPDVTVGLVDFIAAEELNRYRGHWWAPSGDALIVETVDESQVPIWRIADPTYPDHEPLEHRYPHAGATNPRVGLLLHHVSSDRTIELAWDRSVFEYLVAVHWSAYGPPLVQLSNREQTRFETFRVDVESGALHSVDVVLGEPWLDVIPGTPAWTANGQLLSFIDDRAADCRRITLNGVAVTPSGFHVTHVVNAGERPTIAGSEDGRTATALRLDGTRLADGFAWHAFAGNGTVFVRVHHDPTSSEIRFDVLRDSTVIGTIANHAARANVPAPTYVTLGDAQLNAVILWPEHGHEGPLPIIMSPYGGPHHARVLAAGTLYSVDQWLANQGFAVIIADGRGTPGRGLAWDHAIADKFAEITLADQVTALDAAVALYPNRLDATRVGIRGWSYGGYLSALALLARPDRFHVGIAGAPVTKWTLYDTAYTERYFGDPNKVPEVYEENSLIRLAPQLQGKLLIVHGLADDNVVSAHSLQLSAALMAAGKLHDFLPLAGVSHMTPQVTVKENLLRMEAEYLIQHLSR